MDGKKAIGIVRVSERKGREGESFASPKQQRDRIEQACERDDLTLLDVHDEIDMSGGKPLAQRKWLRRAIEAIEAGQADVIVVAYFERLVRSIKVQCEAVERVEAAGGEILTLDHGQITNGTAAKKLEAHIIGAMAQYFREQTAEKSAEAQERAVARGVVPWPNFPPGLLKSEDGKAIHDPVHGPVVVQAFALRSEGKTIKDVRVFLKANGIDRSYHGIQHMLTMPLYIGRIEFGDLVNEEACEPLIDEATWLIVQKMKVSRGRKPKSEKLLARLGVLRCSSCGARMVIGSAYGTYESYRCPPTGDCKNRVAISTKIVEGFIERNTKWILSEFEGSASDDHFVAQAERDLETAQKATEAFVEGSDGLEGPAIRKKLTSLVEGEEAAKAKLDQLRGNAQTVRQITTMRDWDDLTLDDKRGLVKALYETIGVVDAKEKRGEDRVTFKLRMGEIPASRRTKDALLPETFEEIQRVMDGAAR
jgi:DNA invertase Pin-like site-specific DNA recombinase